MVQFTILLLYLSLEGLHQTIKKKQLLLGAFLISLAIGIKLSPIVLIPYLLYRNYVKSALLVIVLCGFYFYLPNIILGYSEGQQLWSDWWSLIEPKTKEQIFDMNNRKNHGISTLLSTLFLKDITDNVVHLSNRRYLIGLSEETVQLLIYSIRALLASFTLYFLRSKPFKPQPDPLSQLWELSYLFLVIPLFFPQQRIYNFIFLLPGITYLIFQLWFNATNVSKLRLKQVLFIIAILVLNMELVLGAFRKFFWHYKTITYATILLLFLLTCIKPKQLTKD